VASSTLHSSATSSLVAGSTLHSSATSSLVAGSTLHSSATSSLVTGSTLHSSATSSLVAGSTLHSSATSSFPRPECCDWSSQKRKNCESRRTKKPDGYAVVLAARMKFERPVRTTAKKCRFAGRRTVQRRKICIFFFSEKQTVIFRA